MTGRTRRARPVVLPDAFEYVDCRPSRAIGTVLLAATPVGLVPVAFAAEGTDTVLQELANRISPRVLGAPAPLDQATTRLDEYFTGRRHRFEMDLDWRLSARFRQPRGPAGRQSGSDRPSSARSAAIAAFTHPRRLILGVAAG
jgi:hypothetical protein